METVDFIFEIIFGVGSVIGLIWIGIFIGKNFGSFGKFIIAWLEIVRKKLEK